MCSEVMLFRKQQTLLSSTTRLRIDRRSFLRVLTRQLEPRTGRWHSVQNQSYPLEERIREGCGDLNLSLRLVAEFPANSVRRLYTALSLSKSGFSARELHGFWVHHFRFETSIASEWRFTRRGGIAESGTGFPTFLVLFQWIHSRVTHP